MEKIVSYNILPIYFSVYFIIFLFRQWGTYKNKLFVKYLLTPLITVFTLFVVIFSFYAHGFTVYRVFILIGLLMSLIGDTVLINDDSKVLIYGLVYFLFTHICYALAFSRLFSYNHWNIALVVLLIVMLIFWFRKLKGKTHGLDMPVLVYMLVISVMIFFAVSSVHGVITSQVILIVTGALLFYISDCILAVNQFLVPLPKASVIVWSIYAPSQLLLAFSCF